MTLDRVRFTKLISNNWLIFKLAFKEAPLYTLTGIFDQALHEVIVFFEHIYLIAYIVDSIQYQRPFKNVLIFVVSVFTTVCVVFIWWNYKSAYIEPKAKENINKAIRIKLFEKAAGLDLECYDNPGFYNDFVWSMSEATGRVEKVLDTIKKLIGAIAGIITAGVFVLMTDRFGLYIVVFAVTLTVFVNRKSNKAKLELDDEMRPLQRKRDYINRVIYLSEFAKELRLSEVKEKLYQDFLDSNKKLEAVAKRKTIKLVLFGFINDYICKTFLFDGIYLMYLLYNAIVLKIVGFGTLTALYRSSRQLKNNMKNFSDVLKEFEQNSLYIDKIIKFLNYEGRIKDNKNSRSLDANTGIIEFRNVSFRYTDDGENILGNINLKISPGEKISLVGYNGAGKTTLIKLLLRLYEPTEGEILLNGVNVREFKIAQYRNLFSTVFQDYQLYSTSLLKNVVMNNSEIDEVKAQSALKTSEFGDRMCELTNGIHTQLGREFDDEGVNLSGGESQKVALSRIFYKDSSIIVLDEPSSALDPISEYKVNKAILNESVKKSVVLISHRLSTTKMADKIYMLENGRIIEQGTHSQLMDFDGKYAEMFKLQAEKYR